MLPNVLIYVSVDLFFNFNFAEHSITSFLIDLLYRK